MTGPRVLSDAKALQRDEERKIMRVVRSKPQVCIHTIHSLTGIPYRGLHRMITKLVQAGDLIHMPDGYLGKSDYQFAARPTSRVTFGGPSHASDGDELLSPTGSLTEGQMRDRLAMLKRMKERLVVSWHPIIDVLIRDYEIEVNRVESYREPPDEDEMDSFDAQDRDFEKEN